MKPQLITKPNYKPKTRIKTPVKYSEESPEFLISAHLRDLNGNPMEATPENFKIMNADLNRMYDSGLLNVDEILNQPGVKSFIRPENEIYFKDIAHRLSQDGLAPHQIQALLAAGLQESGMNPTSKSSVSSAAGLFQFLKSRQTWENESDPYRLYALQYKAFIDALKSTDTENSWHHGGNGSGYNNAIDARNAFWNVKTNEEALRAFTYGFLRPFGDSSNAVTKNTKYSNYQDRLKSVSTPYVYKQRDYSTYEESPQAYLDRQTNDYKSIQNVPLYNSNPEDKLYLGKDYELSNPSIVLPKLHQNGGKINYTKLLLPTWK